MKISKRSALSTVTALFASSIGVSGLRVTGGGAPSGERVSESEAAREMFSAMRRDLNVGEEQLRRRLAFEAIAPAMEKDLRAQLGESFGGSWLNEEGTQLIVAVTDEASAARVRRAGAEPRLVKYSKAQLDRAMAELDRNATSAPSSVHTWYVDVATNSVVVQAESGTSLMASPAQPFPSPP